MRRLIPAVVAAVVALVVGVSPAAATSQAACKADRAGNWEVKLGRETTSKRAAALRSRALEKGLRATLEHDGCGKRWEVGVTVPTKVKAMSVLATARRAGFRRATVEKS